VVKVEKVDPAPEVKEAPKSEVVKKEVHQPKKVVEKITPKPEIKKTVAQKKKYHLIVASLTTEQDAQRMLKNYQNEGHRDAKVIGGNGRFRIALYSYADQKVAYGKLNELKQKDAFKSAWMLTSK
jgi:cell division septation protein DedD